MNDKKKQLLDGLQYFTADEIFAMIQGYSNAMLHYILDETPVPSELLMDISRAIVQVLKDKDVEGRVAIVVLLNAACALYEQAVEEHQIPPCPPDRLN